MFRIACAILFSFLAASLLNAEDKSTEDQFIPALKKAEATAPALSTDLIWEKIQSDMDSLKTNHYSDSATSGEMTAYVYVLTARAVAKEPLASYYYGILLFGSWGTIQSVQGDTNFSRVTAQEALGYIRVAADAKIPAAMYALAMAYKNGYGVAKSNLVAADWLTKTVVQNIADGNRESALNNVEEALQLVPDFPAALKLRGQLLGTSEGNN